MVFCGLFPTDADQFNDMREALGRLQLNDSALSFEPEVQPSNPCCCSCCAICSSCTLLQEQNQLKRHLFLMNVQL